MENLNAVFIHEGMPQGERLQKLIQIAIQQMTVLENVESKHILKGWFLVIYNSATDGGRLMGIATYHSSSELPEAYKNILPSAEELRKLL